MLILAPVVEPNTETMADAYRGPPAASVSPN